MFGWLFGRRTLCWSRRLEAEEERLAEEKRLKEEQFVKEAVKKEDRGKATSSCEARLKSL